MRSRLTTSSVVSGHSAAGTLGEIAVVTLIILLILREMAAPLARFDGAVEPFRTIARRAVVPVVPLLVFFAVIVAVKVWGVL